MNWELLARLRPAWAALCVLAPLGLLFPPLFREEIILRCLRHLPDLTAALPV